jgi:hypothetical protein
VYFKLKHSGRTDILTADLGTGYVGVGTTAPIYAADIKTSGTNNGQLRVGGASTSATGLLLEQTNSGTTTANIQNSYYATSASASLSIKSGYTTFHTGTSGSERMRIDSSGRLLLNTTVEGYTDYADDFTISNTSGRSGMTIRSGATSQGSIFFSDSNANSGAGAYAGYVTYIHSSDSLQLGTSGAERMRIDASGQVGIGISSIPSGAQLYVDTGVNSHAAVFRCDTGGYACAIFDNQASSGTRNFTSFRIDNSIVGSITSTGSTTAYNTSSDHRLKENVVELTGATARLKQLEPKRFNFIADADTTVDGFLAHEVQSVVPEAITGTHNEVDADGNPVYQGIDQSKLVPLLVATIKELEARITALEGE